MPRGNSGRAEGPRASPRTAHRARSVHLRPDRRSATRWRGNGTRVRPRWKPREVREAIGHARDVAGRLTGGVLVQEGAKGSAGDGEAGIGDGLDQPLRIELAGQVETEAVEGLEFRLELPLGRLPSALSQAPKRLFRAAENAEPAAEEADEAALDEEETEVEGVHVAGREGGVGGHDEVVAGEGRQQRGREAREEPAVPGRGQHRAEEEHEGGLRRGERVEGETGSRRPGGWSGEERRRPAPQRATAPRAPAPYSPPLAPSRSCGWAPVVPRPRNFTRLPDVWAADRLPVVCATGMPRKRSWRPPSPAPPGICGPERPADRAARPGDGARAPGAPLAEMGAVWAFFPWAGQGGQLAAVAPPPARSRGTGTTRPLLVDDEGHHHVDLILDDRAVLHPHVLLLHPRAPHVAQRLARAGDASLRASSKLMLDVALISETLAIDMRFPHPCSTNVLTGCPARRMTGSREGNRFSLGGLFNSAHALAA